MPRPNHVVIKLNHGGEVVQTFDFFCFGDGFKIIPQAGVGGSPVRGGQAFVGVAAHDGVQVVFVVGFVPVEQAAFFQIFQGIVESTSAFAIAVNALNGFIRHRRTETVDAPQEFLLRICQ